MEKLPLPRTSQLSGDGLGSQKPDGHKNMSNISYQCLEKRPQYH